MTNKIKVVSIIWNFLVFAAVTSGIILMLFSSDGVLAANGAEMLKYYTVQSNLICALGALLSVIFLLLNKYPKWLTFYKLITTSAVFLTFFTCVVYLGPLYGYGFIFAGANLFLHLIAPLLAIFQFIFDEPTVEMKFWHNYLSISTMAVYGLGYFINLIANNGYGNIAYDWYGFGMFGLGIGVLFYLLMAAIIFGLSLVLYFPYKKVRK